MSKYDKLKQINKQQFQSEEKQYDIAGNGLDEMIADVERTAEVYRNADDYLDAIDAQFEKATGLGKLDVAFLFLATALQVGRWIVIGEFNKSISGKIQEFRKDHNDKSILEMEEEERNNYYNEHEDKINAEKKHRSWTNIVFDGVPYDITIGSPAFGVNMGGKNHRMHTLGHDPVLGWIFGTMNILSDTITLDKAYGFRTFRVEMMKPPKRWVEECLLISGFTDAIRSVREDKNRLPAAVFAQALHLRSDAFTKLGLPVPILEAFSPDFAGKLYRDGYDSLMMMKNTAVAEIQAITAAVINMLIGLIHGLFYNKQEYPTREVYEVKTRKILMWSNIIASSSNVLTVAAMECAAFESGINPKLIHKGLQYLDFGGYAVTMNRIVTDTKFIRKIKKEFLEKEWEKLVIGDEFSFVSGGQAE